MFYQKKNHSLLKKRTIGEKAFVILTGDKGLVGGLWHEVINAVLENVKQYQSFIVIGVKGENYLKEENIPIIKLFTPSEISNYSDKNATEDDLYEQPKSPTEVTYFFGVPPKEWAEHITNYIFNEFKKGTFSRVDILYPQFISLAEQTPNLIPFLPFEFKFKKNEEKKSGEGLPIFEPSKQEIFNKLLQKYIIIFFRKIIIETKLSELSARTVAMEHATTKIEKLIQKLALDYTKERRRIITQRQLESFIAHKII